MLETILRWRAERAGRARAVREIRQIVRGRVTAEALRKSPIFVRSEVAAFARGYAQRWYDEGFGDACAGHTLSRRFLSHDYDQGWLDGMASCRQAGPVHPACELEYVRLATVLGQMGDRREVRGR